MMVSYGGICGRQGTCDWLTVVIVVRVQGDGVILSDGGWAKGGCWWRSVLQMMTVQLVVIVSRKVTCK